ncbi:Serpin A3-7, partial [Armadillidium nasatum]
LFHRTLRPSLRHIFLLLQTVTLEKDCLKAHFEFTLTLFRSVAFVEDPKKNIVFSPLLVSTLLTPTLLTAKEYLSSLSKGNLSNSTRTLLEQFSKQVLQVLSLNDLNENAAEAWHKATVASLQDNYYKNFLKGARGFLIKEKSVTTEAGQRALTKNFGSSLKIVSQPIDSAFVLQEINMWARNKTKNKIESFIGENENFLQNKEKVLLSAAFVKPFWLNDFDPKATFQKGLFYPTYRDRFEIPMMISRLKLPLGYSPSLEARVLEIPFKLRRASLFIVLPDHMEQPLSALESNLTSENMRTLLSTLK